MTLKEKDFPDFIKRLIRGGTLSEETKTHFIMKFLSFYLTNESFRQLTDDCYFLFVEGIYEGCYDSDNDALQKAFDIYRIRQLDKSNGYYIYISAMYVPTIGQYNETCSISTKKIVCENIKK